MDDRALASSRSLGGGLLAALVLAAAACAGSDGSPRPRPAPPASGGSDGSGGAGGSPGAGAGGAGGSGGSVGSGGSGGAAGTGGTGGSAGSPAGGAGGGQPPAVLDGGPGPDAGSAGGDGPATAADAPAGMPPRGELGDPNFPGWRYRKAIRMDTTAAGANVPGSVSNYPVVVRLDAQRFDFSQARPGGEDVRFGTAQGMPLPYQLEHYDSAGKTATFWVRIPQVQGNNGTQSFNMYWGNPAAGLADDSSRVFPSSEGYLGVFHLDEEGSSEPNGYRDSSEARVHGTGVNLKPGSRVDGLMGKGTKTLNAERQWVKVEDAEKRFRPENLTASIWAWADGWPARWGSGGSVGYQTVLSSGEGWTIQRDYMQRMESCFLNQYCAIARPVETKQWIHYVLVRRGSGSQSLYLNGGAPARSGQAGYRQDAKDLGIGQQTQYLDPVRHVNERRSWEGILDEVRLMNVAVTAEWVKLEYESQRPGSTFLSFGPTQMN